MKVFINKYFCGLLLLQGLSYTLFAGPRIEFDTTVVAAPFAIIEKRKEVLADFVFRNTGDADLRVTGIQSGSSSVSVKYDSLVKPGNAGKIRVTIAITSFGSGKAMTVLGVESNAENDTAVRIGIKTDVRSIVDIPERSLTLNANRKEKEKTIVIGSPKKDLVVSRVFFEPDQIRNSSENWKSEQPVPIEFKCVPTGLADEKGFYRFRCTLFVPVIKKSILGKFHFVTNHPEKKEVVVTGTLLK